MAFVVILNNFNLVHFTTALEILNTNINKYRSIHPLISIV